MSMEDPRIREAYLVLEHLKVLAAVVALPLRWPECVFVRL
jgi:hypothetical protein